MDGYSCYRLKVRYPETDAMGIVYHAHYFPWLELGRTELIRELGFPYKTLEEKGIFVPVLEVNVKYLASAEYDDDIVIYTKVSQFSNVKISFYYEIKRELHKKTELLVRASSQHTWMNKNKNIVRLDRAYPELYETLKSK